MRSVGQAISWIAVQAPASAVFTSLGIKPTGEQSDIPDRGLCGASLSTGWYLVFDVPLEVAHRIAGFKHDANDGPSTFQVLEPMPGSILTGKRGWWKLWR